MPAEGAKKLTAKTIPEFKAFVEACANYKVSVWRETYLAYQILMSSHAIQRFLLLSWLPKKQRKIIGTAYKSFSRASHFGIASCWITISFIEGIK